MDCPNLYERTGNICDINTLLINRNVFTSLSKKEHMHNHLVYFLVFLLGVFLAIIAAIYIAVETAPKQPTPIVEGTGLKDTTPWARTLSETGIGGKK